MISAQSYHCSTMTSSFLASESGTVTHDRDGHMLQSSDMALKPWSFARRQWYLELPNIEIWDLIPLARDEFNTKCLVIYADTRSTYQCFHSTAERLFFLLFMYFTMSNYILHLCLYSVCNETVSFLGQVLDVWAVSCLLGSCLGWGLSAQLE